MEGKKIIAVIGATGAQGGGLARAILNDRNGEFSLRAITRNIDSDKAKALADAGAVVVSADMDNQESLTEAFKGAYGVYAVTNFWEHFSPEKEISQAENIAKAAKSAGVKHVIWSTLEDTRNRVSLSDNRMPTLMDKYKVPHFDAKGESDKFFTENSLPVTFLLTSFYWDNFIYFGMGHKKGADGNLSIAIPMGDRKLPGIAAEDIGKCAYGIFKKGNEYIGKTVGISGGHLTGSQMASGFSGVLGTEVSYFPVPFEMFRSFGFPGAEDLGNMFQFKHDFEEYFCGARNLDESKRLNPELLTFESWLEKNKDLIPLE
ncbi:MAG: NmrA/HSCARG family protein [Ignavibacteria bacterium]|nr:NmrA/HSCARG family protein [Ignavibacteria bacterium]